RGAAHHTGHTLQAVPVTQRRSAMTSRNADLVTTPTAGKTGRRWTLVTGHFWTYLRLTSERVECLVTSWLRCRPVVQPSSKSERWTYDAAQTHRAPPRRRLGTTAPAYPADGGFCVHQRRNGRHLGRHRAPTPPRSRYAAVVTSAVVGAGMVAAGTASAMPSNSNTNTDLAAFSPTDPTLDPASLTDVGLEDRAELADRSSRSG